MTEIGIIDYGVGNLGSLQRAFEDLGAEAEFVSRPEALAGCGRLVLPGVGNFADCMALLGEGGWIDPLKDAVAQGRPLLGICVGMQLLADEGTEGGVTAGLGLVPGKVVHLRERGCTDRVPHVGWNAITPTEAGATAFAGIPPETDVYFVHSYTFVPDAPEAVTASASYGVPFTAAVQSGRVWGTQFHPEKSSRAGFRILRNFWKAA